MTAPLSLAQDQRSAAEQISVRSLYETHRRGGRLSLLSSLAEGETSILSAGLSSESQSQRVLALAPTAKSAKSAKSIRISYETALAVVRMRTAKSC